METQTEINNRLNEIKVLQGINTVILILVLVSVAMPIAFQKEFKR